MHRSKEKKKKVPRLLKQLNFYMKRSRKGDISFARKLYR
jgi:hypothetical protein